MATVALTGETFASTVEDNDIVFVDFWARWCGPCQAFSPIFDEASDDNDDVVFGKVDIDDQRELAGALEIQSVPTLMAFRDGYLVFREAGALNRKQLDSVIGQVRELDMDALKAEAAAAAQ
jgi:thioredoxin